jgi:hypothetical protein
MRALNYIGAIKGLPRLLRVLLKAIYLSYLNYFEYFRVYGSVVKLLKGYLLIMNANIKYGHMMNGVHSLGFPFMTF